MSYVSNQDAGRPPSDEQAVGAEAPAPRRETKADRFKRLAKQRVNKVLQYMKNIENLGNKQNYAHTQDQIDQIVALLTKGVERCRLALTTGGTFSLSSQAVQQPGKGDVSAYLEAAQRAIEAAQDCWAAEQLQK